MDFSKIKSFSIPEGKVKSISIGGKTSWSDSNQQQYVIKTGIYKFNDVVTFPNTSNGLISSELNFLSNNESWHTIGITIPDTDGRCMYYSGAPITQLLSYVSSQEAYTPNGLVVEEEYRVIQVLDNLTTGESEHVVTKEFYEWFTSNTTSLSDLTNTTWYIPAGWTASAGYGYFNIEGYFKDDEMSYLGIGYRFSWDNPQSPEENVLFTMPIGNNYTHANSPELTITITGGADVTNPDLIKWLYDNGVQS